MTLLMHPIGAYIVNYVIKGRGLRVRGAYIIVNYM